MCWPGTGSSESPRASRRSRKMRSGPPPMSEIWTQAFMVAVFAGMIRIATPLLFGAMGELVTERSGIMNLGIEGNMLVGAFTGFLAAHATGSLWLGVVAGALAASLSGLLMAFMCTTLKVDQTVTGLAINLLAS